MLKKIEPDEVERRKARRFKRRIYHAAGVYDTWCMDQHDKFQKFGLRFHNGLDPFSGRNVWIKVWWTNKNPRLISKLYIDAARADRDENCAGLSNLLSTLSATKTWLFTVNIGYILLTTQSDPGSENFGVANMHTEIRQHYEPQLKGTLQHRFMREKKNIKSEINWSIYTRDFSPGFHDLFEQGVLSGDYDPANHLER